MAWQGMDPDEAETSAFDLKSSSADLGQITRDIGGLLDQLEWQGADANAFRSGWGDFAPVVLDETDGAADKGRQLRRKAEQQRETSR